MTRAKSGATQAKMKIGALEEASGVSRDTIHFYVRAGLLPRPHKTGATIAYYDAGHLEGLKRIRALRAHGLSLPTIRRLLSRENDRLGPDDLELIAQILSAAERVEPPRADAVPERVRSLADALGVAAESEADARLCAALDAIATLPDGARALAESMARGAVESARATARTEQAEMAAWLSRQDDPDVAVRDVRRALGAVRALSFCARDALVRAAIEADFCGYFDAAASAGRAALLPLAPERAAAAAEEIRALEARASHGEPAAHASLARMLFALGPARRLGEATRRARRAGVGGPWIALGHGVAALDAGDVKSARESFARARAEQPGWGLAAVYEATATLLCAGAGGGGFLRESLAGIRALDRASPSPDDPELDQLWTLLVKAQSLLALPRSLARALPAADAARQVLDRLERLAADHASRVTGEFERLEGNALLAWAAGCRALGDRASETEALRRACAIAGPMGAEARARLTSAAAAS